MPIAAAEERAEGDCRCDGGQPKNFVRPCLLLLLAETPAHGYELMERLRPLGFQVNDPATVYKSLRQMEDEGILASRWDTSRRGPARRIYMVTPDGLDLLGAWAAELQQNRAILDCFLSRFAATELAGVAPVSDTAGGTACAVPVMVSLPAVPRDRPQR